MREVISHITLQLLLHSLQITVSRLRESTSQQVHPYNSTNSIPTTPQRSSAPLWPASLPSLTHRIPPHPHPASASPAMLAAVLIDLSGTLHIGGSAIPGAAAALGRLRQSGLKLRFVTNTTKESTTRLVSTVQQLGFDIQEHEVFSSLRAAKRVVQERSLNPLLLVSPDALAEFEGTVNCSSPHNAVVLGLAPQAFHYDRLDEAFRLLIEQPDAPLIAIHKGKYLRGTDGGLSLGPGPFAAALEFATGRTAEVVGKPCPAFFQLALSDLGITPSAAVMVGDDVRDDVQGAMDCCMAGILVQTGKYLPGDESSKGVSPTATVPDFAAAVDWILQHSLSANV